MRRQTDIKKNQFEKLAANYEVPKDTFDNEEEQKEDPSSKLVLQIHEFERIKKRLLIKMAVMSYLTKF